MYVTERVRVLLNSWNAKGAALYCHKHELSKCNARQVGLLM